MVDKNTIWVYNVQRGKVTMATVLTLVKPSRTKEVHWDLLSGLAPKKTAEILLGKLASCPFAMEANTPDYLSGVIFQIFHPKDAMRRVLMLEVWGSEKKTTYIKLTVDEMNLVPELKLALPELEGKTVELETGVECPLARDREVVLQNILEYLQFIAREQEVAV